MLLPMAVEERIVMVDQTKPSTHLVDVADQMISDYKRWRGPFERDMLPEKQAIQGIDSVWERSCYITLTCALNYNRNARELWERTRQLYDDRSEFFDPYEVVENIGLVGIKNEFSKGGIRYPNRDARAWFDICQSLHGRFADSPIDIIMQENRDARRVYSFVREDDGFPCLGGEKIAPLWIRIMHEDVLEMESVSAIDIPVDVQVVRVTEYLQEQGVVDETELVDQEKDAVRVFWTDFGEEHGFDPVILDQPIWLIGNGWNEWGKEYLDRLIEK